MEHRDSPTPWEPSVQPTTNPYQSPQRWSMLPANALPRGGQITNGSKGLSASPAKTASLT